MSNYIIVMAVSPYDLEEDVNSKMKQGYVPKGGVTTAHTGYVTFMQAMVLTDSST